MNIKKPSLLHDLFMFMASFLQCANIYKEMKTSKQTKIIVKYCVELATGMQKEIAYNPTLSYRVGVVGA